MNVEKLRNDFPVLQKDVVYFDNACMSLKPVQVISAMQSYYENYTACGGRSMHQFSKKVDEEVAKARQTIKKFINAKSDNEIVFTKNTTEAINLIAHSLDWKQGDVVLTSDKEHNSNLVPWQQLKKQGIMHQAIQSNKDNTFNIENLKKVLTKKVKLIAIQQTSNLDGANFPIEEIAKLAHDNGTLILVDAAQSVPHMAVDVKKLDVDFLAFSGHKMLGPTGTGVLYGKYHLLENLNPFVTGGETVVETTYESAEFEKPPHKFEAGLQNYAGIIGLNAAIKYLMPIREEIHEHEVQLNKIISEGLKDKVTIIGPEDPKQRGGIVSFYTKMDSHEIALMLDQQNILIRSGAHCVHSWFNAHNLQGSARASVYFYNTKEEAKVFVEKTQKILALK
ncbi:cysteine desulfurase [Candidatus Woesearchaeota archaeon]|nr:MAG: cysteine desulfurase [Candidatus Woesearchaeota archaeon]